MNLIVLLLLVVGCVGSGIADEIQHAQSLLVTEGPSANVLTEFERLITKLESSDHQEVLNLSQLYFKKSLIEINLNKERDAIKTLYRCLSLDPYLKPARSKLIDLLVEFSLFEDEVFRDLPEDDMVMQKIRKFNADFGQMVALVDLGEFRAANDMIDDLLLPVSPSNSSIYKYQLECLTHIHSHEKDIDPQSVSRDIVNAYSKLMKLEKVKSLTNFKHLSDYLLFTQANFEKAFVNVKQCLRIDNEFGDCVKLSKFYSKFKGFLEQLETYSIELGHIYLSTETSGDNPSISFVDLNDKINFASGLDFLYNGKPTKRQLTGVGKNSIKTNYDYLIYFVEEFKASANMKSDPKLILDLNKFICESYIQTNDFKTANKVCGKVDDATFLPKYIPEIDKLLSQQKFQEVDQIMKKFPANTKQTKLFQSRYEKVETYLNEQHRKQQQQQQQRFHQQQQQQRQRQQQQARPSKPKNDYYKVLDVSRDADEKTIKRAHRTQTLKYHPDKYKGSDLTPEQIEAKMQEVNLAYEVLSNPEMRERYDRGDDPNDPMGGGGGGNPFGGQRPGGNPFGGNFQFNFGNGGGFNFGGFGNQGPKMKFQKNFKKRRQ